MSQTQMISKTTVNINKHYNSEWTGRRTIPFIPEEPSAYNKFKVTAGQTETSNLEKLLVTGKVEGREKRGRSMMSKMSVSAALYVEAIGVISEGNHPLQ